MSSQKGAKLNRLLKSWPQGTVATSTWLESQGFYHQLLAKYQESSWIKKIGHAAFIRDGDRVEWQGALYAIQSQLKLPIFAAARTALELQGITHFVLSSANPSVYLFGASRSKLPAWIKQHSWNARIRYTSAHLFDGPPDLGITEKPARDFVIRISSRERAILELLYLIPQEQDFDEASLIFEGLRTLRPDLVQELLENCRSIKVKRLFLYFADSTNQPWFKDLNLSKIGLGSGKRVIAKGGVFNAKYNISVPKIHKGGDENELEGP